MSNSKKFDLEERTARFGEDVIEFAKKVTKNELNLIFTAIVKKSRSNEK